MLSQRECGSVTFILFVTTAVFLASSLRATTALTISSCAAPRFDTFLSSLISEKWFDDHGNHHVIEEVMRSCGGAVQGVRELDDYHNRADDSFVYYDCGSYSTSSGVYSFVMNEGKTRVIFKMGNDEITDERSCNLNVEYFVEIHRSKIGLEWTEMHSPLSTDIADQIKGKHVKSRLRCRMPAPNQNWMFQRLKWESQNFLPAEAAMPFIEDGVSLTKVKNDTVWCTGWISRVTAIKENEYSGLGVSRVLKVGVISPSTGETKCIARGFDDKNNLKFVELLT